MGLCIDEARKKYSPHCMIPSISRRDCWNSSRKSTTVGSSFTKRWTFHQGDSFCVSWMQKTKWRISLPLIASSVASNWRGRWQRNCGITGATRSNTMKRDILLPRLRWRLENSVDYRPIVSENNADFNKILHCFPNRDIVSSA